MFSDYFCGREDVKLPDKLFIRMDTIFKFSSGTDVGQGNEDDVKMSVKKQESVFVSVPTIRRVCSRVKGVCSRACVYVCMYVYL